MFAISLACLITASYAWFSMTGSVEVTGPNLKHQHRKTYRFQMMEIHRHRQLLLICTRRTILKISPASSYTGIDNNIFYTEDINDGGSAKILISK